MTDQSPRSRVLIERINRETEKCLTVLDRLPRPAKRNARESHVVEAKLAAAETEAECQVLRAERRRLIRESEPGLKEAIRDWHDETNDVVEDLVITFLKPMLKEIESHVAKSNRDTIQTDPPSGVDQVASPRTPTMPATLVSGTNQVQESPSVASNILAAEKVSGILQMTCCDLGLMILANPQEKGEPQSPTCSEKTTTRAREEYDNICRSLL